MQDLSAELNELGSRDRAALRALLIAATAATERTTHDSAGLGALARRAPAALLGVAASHHRVAGSVLAGIAGVEDVPDRARRELAAERDHAAFHHLLTIGALSEIAASFDGSGLDWLVMKGPVLAALLYPHVGDRRYGDLDLLVGRQDFADAVRILESLGYQHEIKNWALAEKMLAGQISMTGPTMSIDLHWHLHYSTEDRAPFTLDPDGMLARSRRRSVSGVESPVLDPADTVVNLGFHAARSGGHRLIWLKDLERAMEVESPDADTIVARAREFDCGPSVGLMLERCRRILEAPIPEELPRALAPRALLVADRAACALRHPIQFDEKATPSTGLVRSVRRSTLATLTDAPLRAARHLRSRIVEPPDNETDDQDEKRAYFDAVEQSRRPELTNG